MVEPPVCFRVSDFQNHFSEPVCDISDQLFQCILAGSQCHKVVCACYGGSTIGLRANSLLHTRPFPAFPFPSLPRKTTKNARQTSKEHVIHRDRNNWIWLGFEKASQIPTCQRNFRFSEKGILKRRVSVNWVFGMFVDIFHSAQTRNFPQESRNCRQDAAMLCVTVLCPLWCACECPVVRHVMFVVSVIDLFECQ